VSAPEHVPNPERLIAGEFGPLLEDANRELARNVDQVAAFQRVTERLSASPLLWPRRSHWLIPATLLLVAGLVSLATVVRRVRFGNAPSVAAEDLHGFHLKLAAPRSAVAEASAHAERAALPGAHDPSASDTALSARRARSPASAKSGTRFVLRGIAETIEPPSVAAHDDAPAASNAAPVPARSDSNNTAPDCLNLARRGQTRDAEACFLKRAEDSGLGAEMALYEVARLRRDVLADPAGALAALAEYRTRFPTGSLRREADMSQLELLLQLGRTDEALKQSDELLSSSSAGERAAELHLLRGHILRKAQSRFADAAREYELAERAGASGREGTYFRALCLEALGQAPEAAAVFAQYLEQPQRAYAEDARRHLQRLKP